MNSISGITGKITNITPIYNTSGVAMPAYKFTLNTLDSNFTNKTINVGNTYLIYNIYNFTSPVSSKNDQLLILGSDNSGNKYIYLPDTNFMQYPFLQNLPAPTSTVVNSGSINLSSDPFSLQLKIYILFYFFAMYGIGLYTQFNAINILIGAISDSNGMIQSSIPILESDPNYNTYKSLLTNSNITSVQVSAYQYYCICNSYRLYTSSFPNYNTFTTNYSLRESDWKYVANYYNTIYTLAKYNASSFCVNHTGTDSTPSVSLDGPNITINCKINNSYSATIRLPPRQQNSPSPNIQTPDDNTPNNTPPPNNSVLIAGSGMLIIGGIIFLCLIIVAAVLFFMYMNKKKMKLKKHGGYYYF